MSEHHPEIVCLNGEFLPLEQARLYATDSAVLWGHSTFSTLRAERGHLLFPEPHFERLYRGVSALGIPLTPDPQGLQQLCEIVLDANQLHTTTARVRITLSRGPVRQFMVPTEGEPTVLITASPMHDCSAADWERGWRVVQAPYPLNEHSPLRSIKSGNYSEYLLAREYARHREADEALLVNTRGRLAECAMANLFWFREGILCTPHLSTGALPGVMRSTILSLWKKAGREALEVETTPEELAHVEEIFCTNSALLMMPITRVGERFVGGGFVGAQTRSLFAELRQHVDETLRLRVN
jgi:branched-subunit amino acid aminotransferase/4-amino-4-deoxychorismate lyase